MSKTEQVQKWADNLTPEQMRPLLVELTCFACEAEQVRLGGLAPYWEATGEPLVAGQKTWMDD